MSAAERGVSPDPQLNIAAASEPPLSFEAGAPVKPFVKGMDPRAASIVASQPTLPPVEAHRLVADFLVQHFNCPPQWQPEMTGDRFRFGDRTITAAAVLIPLVMHPNGLSVLLTQRSSHLTDHAGQIAFPGGRKDDTDPSLEFTALREAQEEIGLNPQAVQVIGRLPDYLTGTAYRIAPIVGLVQPNQALQLQADEVDEAFEVPLSFLMNPANHQQRQVMVGDIARHFYAMPYLSSHVQAEQVREYFIWGATAAILRNLYRFLRA